VGAARGQVGVVVFRSRAQVYSIVSFGTLVVVLGLLGAAQAATRTARYGEAAVAIVVGAVVIGIGVRAAVIITETGILIRNPFARSIDLSWDKIAHFRIGRYRLLGAVCIAELVDGSQVHAFAVQVPRGARTPESREEHLLTMLNERVTEQRRQPR
jgi:hypothetical protein